MHTPSLLPEEEHWLLKRCYMQKQHVQLDKWNISDAAALSLQVLVSTDSLKIPFRYILRYIKILCLE